jgi:vanillate/4-hydroxybenzoate decarboxylase subunit D
VWTVLGCNTCFYTWRSTEPGENTDPEKYPQVFRLNPADLANLPIVPAIQRKR